MTRRLLFVCTENANRSQMAEAFARRHGGGLVEVWSAGSAPGSELSPRLRRAMAARGYELEGHRPKSVADLPAGSFDLVVGMGCGDSCPMVPGRRRLEWDLPDPRDLDDRDYAQVRDDIERRVVALLDQIRAETRGGPESSAES